MPPVTLATEHHFRFDKSAGILDSLRYIEIKVLLNTTEAKNKSSSVNTLL